jgi:hypothetical protein
MATLTGPIEQILVAAAGTAAPTVAALNAILSPTSSLLTAWTFVGSKQNGSADVDIDSEPFVITPKREVVLVEAPGDLTVSDIIVRKMGIESLSFSCYEQSKAALDLASNISTTSNVSQFTATTTKKALYVETKKAAYYFPSVVLMLDEFEGGYMEDGVFRTNIFGQVEGTSSIPGGMSVYTKV